MDATETHGEKARRQSHKNAASNTEQVLEAAANKAAAYGHLPPITKTTTLRRTRHAGYCCRSGDELISDIFPQSPSHGRAKPGRPARTYIQQLCANTGCNVETLPGAIDVQGDPCWQPDMMILNGH